MNLFEEGDRRMNGVSGDQQSGDIRPISLREAIEVLRAHFSSVRLETHLAESRTALSVHFIGDASNIEDRQLPATSALHNGCTGRAKAR